MTKKNPTQLEWLNQGKELGYCSEYVCSTHDGIPTTEADDEEWEAGGDPCQPVVRLWNPEDIPKETKC